MFTCMALSGTKAISFIDGIFDTELLSHDANNTEISSNKAIWRKLMTTKVNKSGLQYNVNVAGNSIARHERKF